MGAQQDRIDREILRSMAASISSGLAFSFHPKDMADCLSRAAGRMDPKPRMVTKEGDSNDQRP